MVMLSGEHVQEDEDEDEPSEVVLPGLVVVE